MTQSDTIETFTIQGFDFQQCFASIDLKHNYETKLVYFELVKGYICDYGTLGPLTASIYSN